MFLSKSRAIILGFILTMCADAFIANTVHAKEGMWIPATLKKQENQMKALGLEIPIEQLYNESGTGLNNAVVLFGKGCTGEVISSQGLILTNHHCGYGTVQGLTSTDKDYFANGYFAKNLGEELPCPGLTVTFVRRMENVTAKLLPGISDTLNDAARDSILAGRIGGLEREYEVLTGLDATIKPYFEGNQYWVAITETFKDVRLTCFPPNGIGQFGGDDENWVWPRHTGDFSVFRVYAGPDNKPAAYSPANKPYNAFQFFNINASGYKEGDFTMVYGFPGTTMEYISSHELNQVYSYTDPISIAARTKKLNVWSEHMDDSRDIFLKYTSKRAGVANGWKKWQGEMLGLKINDAIEKKKSFEKEFQEWAEKKAREPYIKGLLPQLAIKAKEVDDLIFHDQHIKEEVLGIELIQQGGTLEKMAACMRGKFTQAALTDTLTKLSKSLDWFYKNYDADTDEDVFAALMPVYIKANWASAPEYYKKQYRKHWKSGRKWAKAVYGRSILTSPEKLLAFASRATMADSSEVLNDPAYALYTNITALRKQKISPKIDAYKTSKHFLNRLYISAQMEYQEEKIFYPDANLTLRLAYGNVKGLDPDGPAGYSFQTTLSEVIALDDSSKSWYKVPQKLKDLYNAKDYGRWGVKGVMPLAFVADNHTSGGNSGSPVLNSKGELIGTNFDRAYDGTMSDYLFDPKLCRNISVDIRYTLFIIDKFGGAGWLIDEMSIKK